MVLSITTELCNIAIINFRLFSSSHKEILHPLPDPPLFPPILYCQPQATTDMLYVSMDLSISDIFM